MISHPDFVPYSLCLMAALLMPLFMKKAILSSLYTINN